ncbi:MAG: hypothetical protein ACK2T0_08350 [Anaerolineales bacterium]|jgi:hypothetical protein
MACHPLVTQLRFARSEFLRCLDGVSAEEAVHRFELMNCIGWSVGHLANQENAYLVMVAQGRKVARSLLAREIWSVLASWPLRRRGRSGDW